MIETEYIEHQAIVVGINSVSNSLKVRIDDKEECGDCPAASVCGQNGETSNEVMVEVPDASIYHIDDFVTIRGTEHLHRKAIMYATVFPCIILVAVMVGIYLLTFNQLAAALSGIGIMILFFIILWAFRNKIAHEFTFTVTGPVERAGDGSFYDKTNSGNSQ